MADGSLAATGEFHPLFAVAAIGGVDCLHVPVSS